MEEDEEGHEEDRLGVALAKTRRSGNVTSVFAVILNGKTVVVIVSITRGRIAPIQKQKMRTVS